MCRDAGRGLDELDEEVAVFLPVEQFQRQSVSDAQVGQQEFAPVCRCLFDGPGVGVRPRSFQPAFEESVEGRRRRLG